MLNSHTLKTVATNAEPVNQDAINKTLWLPVIHFVERCSAIPIKILFSPCYF